jgi:copper chaperone CopZ
MKLKHIEVEGCIVNIRTGLKDLKGRKVTSVEILPDDHYAGERIWRLIGSVNNRVVQLKKKL